MLAAVETQILVWETYIAHSARGDPDGAKLPSRLFCSPQSVLKKCSRISEMAQIELGDWDVVG